MSSQARLEIVLAALDMASDELKDVRRQVDGLDDGAKRASGGMGKLEMAAKAAAIAGFAVASAAATKFVKDSVAVASAAEEVGSKFDVVFGTAAPRAAENLGNLADRVNRSRFELMEMASSLQDTFVPLGFAREEAADLSLQLTQLATDVASFNNVADADVARAFQSALVGNHETVRQFGIVITESTLKQEAYRAGIAAVGSELNDQQKVQARLNLLIAGTSDAQGDAERTAGSYANTSRGLQAAVKDLQVAFGTGLLPALTPVVAKTTELVGNLEGLIAVSAELDKGLMESAQSAVASGMSYEEYNRSVTENMSAVEQLIFSVMGLSEEQFNAIHPTDALADRVQALAGGYQEMRDSILGVPESVSVTAETEGFEEAKAEAGSLLATVNALNAATGSNIVVTPGGSVVDLTGFGPGGGTGGSGSPGGIETGVDIGNQQHGGSFIVGGGSGGSDTVPIRANVHRGERIDFTPAGQSTGPLIGTVNVSTEVDGMSLVNTLRDEIRRMRR